MENVEKSAISTFHASILFWKHFVDYICIHLTVWKILQTRVPFLDTKINFEWLFNNFCFLKKKKTHTDKYLVFYSHHPLAQKISVAKTLFIGQTSSAVHLRTRFL